MCVCVCMCVCVYTKGLDTNNLLHDNCVFHHQDMTPICLFFFGWLDLSIGNLMFFLSQQATLFLELIGTHFFEHIKQIFFYQIY